VAIFGRNEEKNARVLSELKAIGVPSVAMKVDVTDRAGLEPALSRVESELGGLEILVNNAGIVSLSGGVLKEEPEIWDNVIETQLNAVFLLSKLAARSMLSRKRGKIINIGSMYSYFGSGLVPSYSAAKGAIVQLTKSMAVELAPYNIQVNAIAPGWIDTDMTVPVHAMPLNDEILARTPAGRWGQPEEIAGTAVYLASQASDFVTGEMIRVDGGYAIR
jgi:2-deoxy-D-gluconate 3-dehydrogenase